MARACAGNSEIFAQRYRLSSFFLGGSAFRETFKSEQVDGAVLQSFVVIQIFVDNSGQARWGFCRLIILGLDLTLGRPKMPHSAPNWLASSL